MRLEYGAPERVAQLVPFPCSAPAGTGTATLRRPANVDGEYHFDVFHIHQLARLAGRIGPVTLQSVISRSLERYGVSVDSQSSVPSSSHTASIKLGPSPRTGPTW